MKFVLALRNCIIASKDMESYKEGLHVSHIMQYPVYLNSQPRSNGLENNITLKVAIR